MERPAAPDREERQANESCEERSVLHRVSSPVLSAPSSVERSVLRWPFRPASSATSSVESPVSRRAPLSSVERSVLRRVLSPPSNIPSSVKRSVLQLALRPPLSALSSVDRTMLRECQESWDQRSAPETAERDASALDREEKRAPTGSCNERSDPCVLWPRTALY